MQKTEVIRSSTIFKATQALQSKKSALQKLTHRRKRELVRLMTRMEEIKKIDQNIDDLYEQTSLNREDGSTWHCATQAFADVSVNHAAYIKFHLPIDSDERDLWLVAIGAASRKVVLQRMGGLATVSLEAAENPHPDHYRYNALFNLYASPRQCEHSPESRQALQIIDAPAQWEVLVGLAAVIGQEIASTGCFKSPQDVKKFVEKAVVRGQVSQMTIDMIGMEWTADDAWLTHELLAETWRDVLSIALELVENVSDCQLEESRNARLDDSATVNAIHEGIESLLATTDTSASSR